MLGLEGAYEHWNANGGWDNHTQWGVEFGEDGVPYCVIGAWDEYRDERGLDAVVPKTDNVNAFAAWARSNGQWTEYPSVGAWTDFGAGAHCEIVIGFTATTVTTKGWNSVQTGATDSGQGNGVWVHTNDRQHRPAHHRLPRTPLPGRPLPADHRPTLPARRSRPDRIHPGGPHAHRTGDRTGRLEYVVDDATQSGNNPIPVKTQLWDATLAAAHGNDAAQKLTAQVGALSGAITALTKAGGITAEQVQAAAAAGAKAALDELAAALGKAGA